MQSTRLVVTSMSSTASLPSLSRPSRAKPARVRSSPRRPGSTVTSTNSRSQETGSFIHRPSPSPPELFQEAQVVPVEEPDVVHPMAHHGDALDAQAEGEARDLLGVVDGAPQPGVHRFGDRWVH